MKITEALVTLAILSVLLVGLRDVTVRMSSASRRLFAEAQAVEALRLTLGILDRELAGSRPGLDWREDAAGVALRAYRGWAETCGEPVAGELVGSWRGIRLPDPAKDSLELLLEDGTREVVRLRGAREVDLPAESPCAGTAPGVLLEWDESAPGGPRPVLARLFERGLYALDDALRYRRGGGGRQPLTAAVFDPAASGLAVRGEAVEVRASPTTEGRERARRWGR